MKVKKLNVLLAVTDQLRNSYKGMVNDYLKFFAKSQGAFRGEKRTYTAREGTIDDPSKQGVTNVVTTVKEKLNYFIENSEKFVDALLSQEKTNASGTVKAELVVENKSWGVFTSLELLRLKSLIESSDLGNLSMMLQSIPVRSDSEIWQKTTDQDYADRDVYATDLYKGVAKTTVKTSYILQDPNLQGKDFPPNYQPAVAQKDTILDLGDYTRQNFSGEWSHRERAMCLRRKDILLTAITEALKEANQAEAIPSELTAKKIFAYLFFDEK